MKKQVVFLSLVFILSASTVLAQETGNKNNGTENPELIQGEKGGNQESQQDLAVQENQTEFSQDNGVDKSVQTQNQVQNQEQEKVQQQTGELAKEQIRQQTGANDTEQLKTMIRNKKQEMDQEIKNIKDKEQQKVYQNQNKVREAVHALLATEGLTGDIGPQVSAIAKEFNNSVEKTIKSEEKIQKRNKIVEFFFGGDEEASENILRETNKNKEKIQQLKNLYRECDCDEEVKNIIQEQIQNIEQEQNRLGQLAQEQKAKKGLFGWLFGWMKK